jgi:hypothetical protein
MMTIIEPGKLPVDIRLDYEPPLDMLKSLVGGYIECVTLSSRSQVICNEDGHRLGLEPNPLALVILHSRVNMGPMPVGTYLVLTGKERLK